jgi:hypothetical protein
MTFSSNLERELLWKRANSSGHQTEMNLSAFAFVSMEMEMLLQRAAIKGGETHSSKRGKKPGNAETDLRSVVIDLDLLRKQPYNTWK